MNTIEEHVHRLFKDIPESERKDELMREITLNLNEKVSDLIVQGKAQEDAVNKAIVDFGDIRDIRAELMGGPVEKEYRKVKNAKLNLEFSIWGSILIIALCLFMNFYYTPRVIWFVYPTFGVLWWPLSMSYHLLKKKREADELE